MDVPTRCPLCGGPEVATTPLSCIVGTYCRDCGQRWASAPRAWPLIERKRPDGCLARWGGSDPACLWKGRLLEERPEGNPLQPLVKG